MDRIEWHRFVFYDFAGSQHIGMELLSECCWKQHHHIQHFSPFCRKFDGRIARRSAWLFDGRIGFAWRFSQPSVKGVLTPAEIAETIEEAIMELPVAERQNRAEWCLNVLDKATKGTDAIANGEETTFFAAVRTELQKRGITVRC